MLKRPMELRRFQDPDSFFDAAGPYLIADEPRHNLELGILSQLRKRPGLYPEPPYLAVVERDGRVAGVAMRTPPFGALLAMVDPAVAAVMAEKIHEVYDALPSVLSTPKNSEAFAEAWTRVSGQRAVPGMRQGIYRLDDVPDEPDGPGRIRPALNDDRDLLVRWVTAFLAEAVPQQPPGREEQAVDDRLAASDAGLVCPVPEFWRRIGFSETTSSPCPGPPRESSLWSTGPCGPGRCCSSAGTGPSRVGGRCTWG